MLIKWLTDGLAKPGKNQRGLAVALGVDPAAISRLVKGDRNFKTSELARIAQYIEEPLPPGYSDALAASALPAAAPDISGDLQHLTGALGSLIAAKEYEQARMVWSLIGGKLDEHIDARRTELRRVSGPEHD